MKKVMMLMVVIMCMTCKPSFAKDLSGEDLLSLATLTMQKTTQTIITTLLGKPGKIEESRKRSKWYYIRGNATMVLCWSKKSATLEKVFFNCETTIKNAFDNSLSYKLKSGVTNINQAIKLLGTPKDMTIKESTQEVHYAYQNSVLRLFFRDQTLVDFCLY